MVLLRKTLTSVVFSEISAKTDTARKILAKAIFVKGPLRKKTLENRPNVPSAPTLSGYFYINLPGTLRTPLLPT